MGKVSQYKNVLSTFERIKLTMNRLFTFFKSLIRAQKDYKIQSFTFFIPSPPSRATGYREKQFDKLFYEFINRGYKILNFTTQASSSGGNHSGMWILCLVQATNAEAEKLNLEDVFAEQMKSKSQVKEEVEGLYYIDDRANEL
ncbi:MAG: hypothetical protein H7177_16640 [Rhizobacter sp.]|nr:hypothetical protein [Bacteriovorax sp.]